MRLKKLVPVIICVLVVIVICLLIFLYYIFTRQNVIYENIDNSGDKVSVEEAKKSTPLIINNLLLGGVYEKKFVSAEKFFTNSTNIANIDLGIYTMSGKGGTYQLTNFERSATDNVIYANTTRLNYIEEYIAVIDSINISNGFVYENDKDDEVNKNIIKKAIDKYILPNNSIKILKSYNSTLSDDKEMKIVTATSDVSADKGIYSAIIAEVNGKVIPIKINYIKDKNFSSSWPVYNLKFVYDLNGDGVNEVIIEEVDEFYVKYSVMQFKNNKFVEVLSVKKAI